LESRRDGWLAIAACATLIYCAGRGSTRRPLGPADGGPDCSSKSKYIVAGVHRNWRPSSVDFTVSLFGPKESLQKTASCAVQSPHRRSMAGDMQITCSDCGQEFTFSAADQTFFQERGYSTPKRCKPCRMAKKSDQGGSGYRSAPSQGTPVICSGCGQPTTVPFEPRGDRPVYCRDCYTARKGTGGGGRGRDR
jgi:CxxC-x17-CxxC domain-containing protein